MSTNSEAVAAKESITPVVIEDEMKRSYLDYAMSVIVARALPDVRDGLKPVHRRILYAMKENGYDYNKPFRKSARIVGDVMGKYHPHGDSSIYEAMVRMAQDFSMRLPLIASQGNFGSMDGDPPAAMRYTEARLAIAASSLLDDIDEDTVNFQPNYDESTKEPEVLPATFPNVLVNGSGGIAVGMATNIPPHNLGEVIDACVAYIDSPEITPEELLDIVPGPDFPTGGVILGRSGSRSALLTGRGSIIMRAKSTIEEIKKDKFAIVVTEIPYQVNKAEMITKIAQLVRDKVIEGISDLRDESDRQGVRVVIELKRDAHAEVVLNQLYKYTPLQTSFGANILALNNGRPMIMGLHDIIKAFVSFREEVVRRRTIFKLTKARDQAHILVGLAIAVANIDEIIELIRSSSDPASAREQLMTRKWAADDIEALIELIDEPDRKVIDGYYELSETQARAILDLKLHRLTGLERDKIHGEVTELGGEIKGFLSILASREKLYAIIREELLLTKEKFANPRRTKIEDVEYEQDIEDLIPREDMVVTVTNTGYIKRVPLSTYRAQKRGGKGRSGMSTRQEDFVKDVFVANTHSFVLFFSSKGMVYKLKVYRLPEGTPQSLGKAMINILPLEQGETIATVMQLPADIEECKNKYVMFSTSIGGVRRNRLSDFVDIRSNGKIAMKFEEEGETLVNVAICDEEDDILLAAKNGKCLRFPVTAIRVFAGRSSTGVRGMRLDKGDVIVSMSVIKHAKADTDIRDAYLKESVLRRRLAGASDEHDGIETETSATTISEEDFIKMQSEEQFILTVTDAGFGKRSSAYEYRITGRGGSGIVNIDLAKREGSKVVASFPVTDTAHILMVTDAGQIIRMPVKDVRIAGRNTMGVIMFRTASDEKVVSAIAVEDLDDEEDIEGELEEKVEDSAEATASSGTEANVNEEGVSEDTVSAALASGEES